MASDDPSVILAEIGDRNEKRIKTLALTDWTVGQQGEGDIRRMRAALDAVLKLAEKYDAESRRLWDQIRDADGRSVMTGSKSIDAAWNGDVAKAIREAITRELTRKGNDGG